MINRRSRPFIRHMIYNIVVNCLYLRLITLISVGIKGSTLLIQQGVYCGIDRILLFLACHKGNARLIGIIIYAMISNGMIIIVCIEERDSIGIPYCKVQVVSFIRFHSLAFLVEIKCLL